jgi:hypothetical protein
VTRWLRYVGVCLLALITTGCSSGSSNALPNRRAFPACGVSKATDSLEIRRSLARCFYAAAAAGRKAELIIDVVTVEGKRFRQIDRVVGPHSFEVFRREGSASWVHELCPVLNSDSHTDPFFAGCREV